MLLRFALIAVTLLGLGAPSVAAPPSPRDEALRLAPPDFALVGVVQNLRGHLKDVTESPFAAWFPTSALGKQLGAPGAFKAALDGVGPVFAVLGITPGELVDDVIGDAVVFAYTPDPKGERSVILIRPRKPERLAAVMDRLNDAQKKTGELKELVEHRHAGGTYLERRKADGPSDFYFLRDGVFAFTQSEPDARAALGRAVTKDAVAPLVERLTALGVGDAAAVVLVNPRPFDAELAAAVKAAKGDERAALGRFADVWAATDALAVYLHLGTGAELGVSARFAPDKLPPALKGWLVGERRASALWASVPDGALLAVAGRTRANEVLDALALLTPADAKPGVREAVAQTLGPIVGKAKLQVVLDALGPDWAVWVEPPAKGAAVPVAVAAVKVEGADAARSIRQALEFAFQSARVAYNKTHADQLELAEEKDGEVVITSLSGEVFPVGFRPSFALKGGHLVLATSPDAVRAFKPPGDAPPAGGEVPLVRLNGSQVRAYLTGHGPALAKVLATAGAGSEKELAEQLGNLALVLEPVERVEVLTRGDPAGLKLMVRVRLGKPLKK